MPSPDVEILPPEHLGSVTPLKIPKTIEFDGSQVIRIISRQSDLEGLSLGDLVKIEVRSQTGGSKAYFSGKVLVYGDESVDLVSNSFGAIVYSNWRVTDSGLICQSASLHWGDDQYTAEKKLLGEQNVH